MRQDSLLARAIFWEADRQLDDRLFREADLDGDGTLSPAKFAPAAARLLDSGSVW